MFWIQTTGQPKVDLVNEGADVSPVDSLATPSLKFLNTTEAR
jgi:hypothetical protein